jgi:hypothetical protein
LIKEVEGYLAMENREMKVCHLSASASGEEVAAGLTADGEMQQREASK